VVEVPRRTETGEAVGVPNAAAALGARRMQRDFHHGLLTEVLWPPNRLWATLT